MIGNQVDERHHVVIVGGGFGGLFAAKALRRTPVRVTLIDRTNHHLFQPLLYQVATGILSEGQIAPATRDVFRKFASMQIMLAEVEEIDLVARQLTVSEFDRQEKVDYDSLIVAGGAVTSYFGHDEFTQWACGMKSLDDAMYLRGQIFGAFERAEAEEDDEQREALMTFVVVGGGPTGVEMAGQLRELARRALRRNYRRIDPAAAKVVLVEGTDGLVASMGSRLSNMTKRDLTSMGVDIRLNAMVTGMDSSGVELTKSDGSTERVVAATKIWAAGTRASPLASKLTEGTDIKLERNGKVIVEPDCSLRGYPEVFVVGDMMALNDLPGVAEVAMQSGAHAAHAIHRRLKGNDVMRPFHYRDLGTLAAISRFRAVAKVGPLRIGGFAGWLLWLVVHVTFLTGFKNRLGALGRWAISFVGRGRYERALTGRWVMHETQAPQQSP